LLGTIGVFALMLLIFNEKQKQKIFVLKQEQQATNQQIFDLMINQQEIIARSRNEEKNRMAKELHDGVLGKLFGTRLFLDGINSNTSIEAVVSRKTAIVELQNIEQQIREISHDMSSEKGKIINNFVGIVIDLIESQKKTHGTKLKFVMDEKIHWEKLDNFAKINLYRILQESLQNINKYAQAKKIGVSFSEDANFIQLKITDDGKGFDVKKGKKGIGIANMKERAEESKGEYKIESTLTVGTTTTVALPTNLEKTKPTSI
jgi:signal transduction histidine kinase